MYPRKRVTALLPEGALSQRHKSFYEGGGSKGFARGGGAEPR